MPTRSNKANSSQVNKQSIFNFFIGSKTSRSLAHFKSGARRPGQSSGNLSKVNTEDADTKALIESLTERLSDLTLRNQELEANVFSENMSSAEKSQF